MTAKWVKGFSTALTALKKAISGKDVHVGRRCGVCRIKLLFDESSICLQCARNQCLPANTSEKASKRQRSSGDSQE